MSHLNGTAKTELLNADITQAEWAHQAGWEDGEWHGDVCGCSDDRCIGFHHEAGEECGCLTSEIERFVKEQQAKKEGNRPGTPTN